jgi:hypothetical protein
LRSTKHSRRYRLSEFVVGRRVVVRLRFIVRVLIGFRRIVGFSTLRLEHGKVFGFSTRSAFNASGEGLVAVFTFGISEEKVFEVLELDTSLG